MRRCFCARFTLLYIERIEQENNVDDDFNEDLRTFLMSYFLSTFAKYFSGVSTIIIGNELCRRLSWNVEFYFFIYYYLSL